MVDNEQLKYLGPDMPFAPAGSVGEELKDLASLAANDTWENRGKIGGHFLGAGLLALAAGGLATEPAQAKEASQSVDFSFNSGRRWSYALAGAVIVSLKEFAEDSAGFFNLRKNGAEKLGNVVAALVVGSTIADGQSLMELQTPVVIAPEQARLFIYEILASIPSSLVIIGTTEVFTGQLSEGRQKRKEERAIVRRILSREVDHRKLKDMFPNPENLKTIVDFQVQYSEARANERAEMEKDLYKRIFPPTSSKGNGSGTR